MRQIGYETTECKFFVFLIVCRAELAVLFELQKFAGEKLRRERENKDKKLSSDYNYGT